jgi:dTMP kinase
MTGYLIAFEGLDQSGKQTQAESLAARLRRSHLDVELISFPDYSTPIGLEIDRALHGEREFGSDVMQLLYVANRYEWKRRIDDWLGEGVVVLCDRYVASSIAYGETQGLDPEWLTDVQRHLPQPALTVLLDIAPATAVRRKAVGRDRYERDLALLERVRHSYRRQAADGDWLLVDGERPKEVIAAAVAAGVTDRLALR